MGKIKKFNQMSKIRAYHGTTDKHLNNILKNGLNNPYLSENDGLAEYYAMGAVEEDGGNPIILEVLVDPDNLRFDYNATSEPVYADGYGGSEEDVQNMYSKMIEDHPDWVDKKFDTILIPGKEWEYSWDYVKSVKYRGVIDEKYIRVL